MKKYTHNNDGVDHINIYSKGKTALGMLLSNFAHTPFTGGNKEFASVEAWWYWYSTGKMHSHLMLLHGFNAKKEGRKYKKVLKITGSELRKVYDRKLVCNPKINSLLKESKLPFAHYYVYSNKEVIPSEYLWTATLWDEFR